MFNFLSSLFSLFKLSPLNSKVVMFILFCLIFFLVWNEGLMQKVETLGLFLSLWSLRFCTDTLFGPVVSHSLLSWSGHRSMDVLTWDRHIRRPSVPSQGRDISAAERGRPGLRCSWAEAEGRAEHRPIDSGLLSFLLFACREDLREWEKRLWM